MRRVILSVLLVVRQAFEVFSRSLRYRNKIVKLDNTRPSKITLISSTFTYSFTYYRRTRSG
jgi:hypothetical protein